jgi:hypothetical protein
MLRMFLSNLLCEEAAGSGDIIAVPGRPGDLIFRYFLISHLVSFLLLFLPELDSPRFLCPSALHPHVFFQITPR